MVRITKRFGPIAVLQDVDVEMFPGEVLVLAGENGAGKSTLIKILGGVHRDFTGRIELDGHEIRPQSPLDAARLGIAVIHQELSLVGPMSVAENIFLGRPLARGGFVQRRLQEDRARQVFSNLGLNTDVTRPVEDLPIALQQMTEIAKAFALEARVMIMDEPTSSLTAQETERLFALISELKRRGCAIVYITHRMDEISRLADRITVLRDGRHISTAPAHSTSPEQLVRWMVGRDFGNQPLREAHPPAEERLRLDQVSVADPNHPARNAVSHISLSVRAGEIVGLAGLQGSGASTLLMGIFGAARRTSGEIFINQRRASIRTPRHAIRAHVGFLPNDRKAAGLVLSMRVWQNTTLADLPKLSPAGWLAAVRERRAAAQLSGRLNIRAPTLETETGWLSGGNQQKVALSKWLQIQPQVLLLDEPTRGIDIGAKWEIYHLLDELTRQGIAILLITSELPELLGLSDRIIVLHRGQQVAELHREEATADAVLRAAMGDPLGNS